MARIAVIDDSRLVRTVAAQSLAKVGHEVTEVEPSSLFEVLRNLRENPPDLIITDYLMPFCPGISLVRACREDAALKEIAVIVITAHHDEEVIDRLVRMGNLTILHKPFDPNALQEVVAECLSRE